MRVLHPGHFLRRADGDHFASRVTSLGAEVDDVVGGLHHIQVVLDDQHCVAQVNQAIEHMEQLLNVGEVQTSCRFIEDVEGAAGVAAA